MSPPVGAARSGVVGARVGDAIPDSAIGHWPHAAGSGTNLSDEVGTNDGTISGASWVSDSWIDGQALDYGGTGDSHNVQFSNYAAITISGSYSVALTIETKGDVSTDQRFFGHNVTTDDRLGFQINNGSLRCSMWNGSSWSNGAASGSVSTNTRYRIFYVFDSGAGTLYLNNSEQAGTDSSNGAPGTGMVLGQQIGGGTPGAILTDDLVLMDVAEDATTVESDYNRQPWS